MFGLAPREGSESPMPRPPVPLLSREAIITRALEIIDAEGAPGLSMRRLASDLGVSGPSLYHHFASKDEIIDAIIDRINSQIVIDDGAPGWEGVLSSYAYQLRTLLIAHPHMVEFVALRPVTQNSGLRIYEEIFAQLSRHGWDPTFGREVTLAIENLVFGAALMANAPDISLTAEEQSTYPGLAKLLHAPHKSPDDGFEIGFAALIEGLRRLISAPSRDGDAYLANLDSAATRAKSVSPAGQQPHRA
jgi:AcrR family transcriptional regulator